MADLQASKGAVVLLSGGLDSTVALADTLLYQPIVRVLTFDYGQRAVARELAAASVICARYALPHQIITLPWLAQLLPPALTPGEPTEPPADRAALMAVERVWVPNRNGVFLNIAASFAEALGADTVVFGANAEEGADFPDNTETFRERLNATLAYSTLSGVRVSAPLAHLDKQAIIERGQRLGVPFELMWSCYEGSDRPCGQCPSCIRLQEARERIRQSARLGVQEA